MKYLIKVHSWTLIIGMSLLGISTHKSLKAGPTAGPIDDFNLAFSHAPASEQSYSMSVDQITQIFKDHLAQVPQSLERPLAEHLVKLSQKYSFDPALILSLIHVESRFRAKAVSPVGALGLMQLMPGTAQFIAKLKRIKYRGAESLSDPFVNLTLGVAYLEYLREKYRNHAPYFHIAAYNIGPARLDELMTRKNFKPTKTKKYYDDIVKGVFDWRYYNVSEVDRRTAQTSGV